MRGLAILLAVAACGRIGFRAQLGVATGDAGGDARDGRLAGSDAPDGPPATVYYQISTTGTIATLFSVDLPSGQLAEVGTFTAPVVMGGLAYGGPNTLYATGINTVFQITLSPFSATQIQTVSGSLQTLERDGADLIGVLDSTHTLARFTPGNPMTMLTLATTATAAGGDIAQLSNGTWYWFTNTGNQLFTIDVTTGAATLIGSSGGTTPYVAGLLRDDTDTLFLTSGSTAQIVEIDKTTAQLGTPRTLCVTCPTPATLGPGDATRAP